MVRQTTKVIILEVLGVLSLLLMAAVATLAFMLISGPVELGMFRDDVERALTNTRDGRAVTIDKLTLEWSPRQRRLFVVASGMSFKNAQGQETGIASRADVTLDSGAILLGEAEVLRLHFEDGWMNLQNTAPNRFELGGYLLPEIKAGVLPQTPREWLERTNAVLGDLLGAVDVFQANFELEQISFDNMEVRYLTTNGDEVARISNTSGKLARIASEISLALSGEGSGVGLPGQIELALSTADEVNALRADLTVRDWPVTDLAGRIGWTGLNDGGLTADITLGSGVTRSDGVQRIDINIVRKDGTLKLPFAGERLNDLYLDISYIIESDAIDINTLSLETDRLGGLFTGRLDHVLSENTLRQLELKSRDIRLDMSELFPTAWRLTNLDVEAELSDDFSIISFSRLKTRIDDVDFQATAELDLDVDAAEDEIPFSADVTVETIGEFDKETLLKFWPETLGDGARRFVVNRVLRSTITGADANLTLRPDSLAEGFLRDEDLLVNFSFRDIDVRFLSDVPAATNAIGTGRLTGNSFSITATEADYDDWKMDRVLVEFPAFNPRGEDFTVEAHGSGPAVSVLRNLSASRLRLQERTGFDPERVSGNADATFKMSRPALDNVPFEDIEMIVTGRITDAGLANAVGNFDLTEGAAQVDMTQDRLIITGYGEMGNAPVQFTWRDGLDDSGDPADLSATAIVTPDVLNRFGLVGRAYLSGEIPVEMQGEITGEGLGAATFSFDLDEARIDINEIGWVKPAGDRARATLSYSGNRDTRVSAVRLLSETAELDGDVALGSDGRLQTLTLRKLYIEDIADVAGTIRRLPDDVVALSLNGAYLDVSPLLKDIGAVGGAGEGLDLALQFDAVVDRLQLRRGLRLSDAELALVSTKERLQSITANGTTQSGADLQAGYEGSADSAPKVFLKTGDAGFVTAAFLDIDYIRGGILDLTGTLARGRDPMRLQVSVKDARLVNAPFFTQILSLASLRGMADTLSGEGVLLTEIEVPVTVGGGRYVIDGGRASGPALGLTVNGWVSSKGDGIELDGVLVPSFGVNSMLGGVPVIGDLFVGREGEGIFSITYSVSGTLEKAQVAVNPLSAVTPGILRRIFENPSDTSIPSSLPVDPNLKPPTAKLPELPDDEFIPPQPGGGG